MITWKYRLFGTLKCSDKNLPNSSCHFPNHKPVFPQILHGSSVSLKITPFYLFLVKCYIICTKGTNHSVNFGELIAWIKVHQILVIFETTNQFFIKFCITLSVSWDITALYFFIAEISYIFNKRSLSKCNFGKMSPEQLEVWNFALWWSPVLEII